MRIGIVSDTHGRVPQTRLAVERLEMLDVARVLHCGDIGSVGVIDLFAPWPTHFVFGNVDWPADELRRAIENAGQSCEERFGSFQWEGRRIALLHGDDGALLQDSIDAGQWDLVCHGHTHVARQEWIGSTLVLNPGAIHRARQHSIAVVELPSLEATIVPLNLPSA